jgi:hypothetical protein
VDLVLASSSSTLIRLQLGSIKSLRGPFPASPEEEPIFPFMEVENHSIWCWLFFFPVSQGLTLVRQALSHLNHSTSPFCIAYFWDRVSLYSTLVWTTILLFVLPQVTRITRWATTPSHRLRWDHTNFCSRLA